MLKIDGLKIPCSIRNEAELQPIMEQHPELMQDYTADVANGAFWAGKNCGMVIGGFVATGALVGLLAIDYGARAIWNHFKKKKEEQSNKDFEDFKNIANNLRENQKEEREEEQK